MSADKIKEEEKIESELVDAETVAENSVFEEQSSLGEEETDHSDNEDSVTILKAQLEAAEQKAEENYQKFLRAQADLDNVKRRTRKEKEDQAKYASLPLLEQILPALDNFERAIEASKGTQDIDSIIKGVEMVFRQMEQVFQKEGVEVIPSVGQPFDPNVHQAVMQVESDEFESGTVVEELQKGYILKDKVIRPSMVKVSV
jgi:molecular chaperone GrpE